MRRRTWLRIVGASAGVPLAGYLAWQWRDELVEKRFAVVEPGRIYRGAWQRPGPLRRILAREGIRTVVTLTAINADDPKYVDQARVLRDLGVAWRFVPIKGSYASVAEMARAADLIADPALQPVFYHCVAGHHRSSQAQAAYRIARSGWSADRAWAEVAALPWAKPEAPSDLADRARIEAFALARGQHNRGTGHAPPHAPDPSGPADPADPLARPGGGGGLAAPALGQLRDRPHG